MRTGYSNRFSYNDPLLRKRRRKMLIRVVLVLILGASILASGVYAFFFSQVFAINEIKIEGLRNVSEESIRLKIQDSVNTTKFKYIPWGKNILFFSSRRLVEELLGQNPELKTATITKQYFHTVTATFQERQAVGIWCITGKESMTSGGEEALRPAGRTCQYFDDEGSTWGKAVSSSGSLIAVVHDERNDVSSLDKEFLPSIQTAIPKLVSMGLGVKRIQIIKESFGDFNVFTSNDIPIMLSLDSDIIEQLSILKTFLDQKAPANWKPQYIDLRIKGRIYYK